MKKEIQKHNRSDWRIEKDGDLKNRFGRYANGKYLDWVLDIIKGTMSLSGTLKSLLSSFGYTGHYSTPNYTYNYLYYCNQLNKAFFEYSMNDGKPVSLQVADKTLETIGKSEVNYDTTGAIAVVKGIELALILRDKEALSFYANIPVTFTEKAQHDDLVVELMLHFFQLLVTEKANEKEVMATYAQITKQMKWEEYRKNVIKTDFLNDDMWQYLFGHRQEKTEFLYFPLLNIYYQIFLNSQAGFDNSVYEALQKWQQYFTKKYIEQGEEFDRSFEPEGYWCIPVIAACAFAYDRGLKLKNLQSDYLCDWMIEGRFEDFELLVKGDSGAA